MAKIDQLIVLDRGVLEECLDDLRDYRNEGANSEINGAYTSAILMISSILKGSKPLRPLISESFDKALEIFDRNTVWEEMNDSSIKKEKEDYLTSIEL